MAAELLTCWQVWQSYHKTERCSLFCRRMCYTVTFTASVIDMLPPDAMHKHGVCRYAVSVRLSVTFVEHVKTNKHIFENFLPSGNHTILVFPYQTGWRYSDGNPPNGGVECRWGIGRNRDSGLIAGYRRLLDVWSVKTIYWRRSWVYDTVGHAPLAIDRLLDVRTTKWQKQLLTTIQCRSHSRRRTSECLFVMACSMDEYDKEKRTENNLIVRSGISEAKTANNKRLRSAFCIEAIQTRSIARPLCDSWASCFILLTWLWCKKIWCLWQF